MQVHINKQITNIWKKYGNGGTLLEQQIFFYYYFGPKT